MWTNRCIVFLKGYFEFFFSLYRPQGTTIPLENISKYLVDFSLWGKYCDFPKLHFFPYFNPLCSACAGFHTTKVHSTQKREMNSLYPLGFTFALWWYATKTIKRDLDLDISKSVHSLTKLTGTKKKLVMCNNALCHSKLSRKP